MSNAGPRCITPSFPAAASVTTAEPTPLEQALLRFRSHVDPGASAYAGPPSDLPAHWRDYLSQDADMRLACLQGEMAVLGEYLPQAATAVRAGAEDAFLLTSPSTGLLRCVMRRQGDALYPTISAPPLGQTLPDNPAARLLLRKGPEVLRWIQTTLMDGLTDMWGFGGPLRSARLTSMAAEIDTYAEADWFDAFSIDRDPSRVIEIFASGGGGYLLVDLDDPGLPGTDPQALLGMMKEDAPPEPVPLYPWLDEWTAIAHSV